MSFANPHALWLALLPLAATLYLLKRRGRVSKNAVPVQRVPLSSGIRWAFRGLFALFLSASLLFILAAARPQRTITTSNKTSESIDIAIVLDVSESMEATDFAPNRMTVAKAVIRDFIERRSSDRIALVTFGGESVTKVPLTSDHSFLLEQLESVVMRELRQGTAIGMGLSSGIARLRRSESKTKIIVLITDGDSNVGAINPVTAAHLARQEGIKVYSIGIGKENRVVVPIYAYDPSGRRTHVIAQVPSYINPELLKNIARVTGANAYMARDSGALEYVLREIDRLEKTKVRQRFSERQEELFLPFGLTALALLLLAVTLQETRLRRVRALPRHFMRTPA